jgi:glycerol-3-phosphate dehydrogenase (NAD(P)+)
MSARPSIAVMGGGAFGTALGTMAASNGSPVMLFARNIATVTSINDTHCNDAHLPGIRLHPLLTASTNAADVLKQASFILCAVPAQALSTALQDLKEYIPASVPLIICAKGIERSSGLLMSQAAHRILPGQQLCVLSGPSFATDIARGLPTAVTIASRDQALADNIALALSGTTFRCYSTDDVTGVEIGGALKNVLAIAAGAAIGKGYGASAQAALVTRGFVELRRIGQALGARPETIMGLSGLGDLMLTCSTLQSRNYSYGLALGKGEDEDLAGRPLAEGVATASIAVELAARHGVDAPIISAVSKILNGEISVGKAMETLLSRPLKNED